MPSMPFVTARLASSTVSTPLRRIGPSHFDRTDRRRVQFGSELGPDGPALASDEGEDDRGGHEGAQDGRGQVAHCVVAEHPRDDPPAGERPGVREHRRAASGVGQELLPSLGAQHCSGPGLQSERLVVTFGVVPLVLPIFPTKNGSSPNASSLRPHRGSRAMLTVGLK
jgi:hypothetical protein